MLQPIVPRDALRAALQPGAQVTDSVDQLNFEEQCAARRVVSMVSSRLQNKHGVQNNVDALLHGLSLFTILIGRWFAEIDDLREQAIASMEAGLAADGAGR